MIVSIHHYELAESVSTAAFYEAVRDAEQAGLFDLPGLSSYRFLRGIKGDRTDGVTALWEYESRDAWEALWGPVDDPISKAEYPARWIRWEDEYLAPLLAQDPDEIPFTSYEVLESDGADR